MNDEVALGWTDKRKATLEPLEQGDVVVGLPVGYYGCVKDAAAKPSLELPAADPEELQIAEFAGALAPRFTIITSQSCDLAEEAPQPKRPWFLVAPVFERVDLGDRSRFSIDILKVRYLTRLTGSFFRVAIGLRI